MKVLARTLCLRDDPAKIELYKEYHRNTWPEVLTALRSIGIEQMLIFLRGTRMFMYCEVGDDFDPDRDFAKLVGKPRYDEWEDIMHTLQERAPEARSDEWWAPMERVFDMKEQIQSQTGAAR